MGRGDNEDKLPRTAPTTVTVEQVLRDPSAFDEGLIELRGSAYPVGSAGFVLTDDGKSLFVGAPGSDLQQLEAGERVTVVGEVEQLTDTRAETVEDALDAQADTLEDRRRPDIGPGKPILALRSLRAADA